LVVESFTKGNKQHQRRTNMVAIEIQLNEALAKITAKDVEIVALKEAVSAGKIAIAKAERDGQLKESKLPVPCVNRLSEAFAKSIDNAGLKEAINVEAEYVKSLSKITKHNGAAEEVTESDAGANQEAQYKACKASGMSEAEAVGFSGYTPKK
jgi:hypothetical protein